MKIERKRAFGGRIVKWKGRVASIAPALASVSVVALMATGAVGQTVIDTPLIAEQMITLDEDVTITADGSITVDTSSGSAALYIDVSDYSSVVTNNGQIELSETSARAPSGIWLEGYLTGGSILNNGDITVEVSNSSLASASGIYVTGDVSGKIANAGTIDVHAEASSSASAWAYGIDVSGSLSGVITNSGHITVEAHAEGSSSSGYTYAYGYGIRVVGGFGVDGEVVNSGSIDVSAQAFGSSSAYAYAYGIGVLSDLDGTVTNSGTITVAADNTDGTASAYGIYVSGTLNGTIDNSGTISVAAQSTIDDATVSGIYVDGVGINGLINVSGLIEAKAITVTDGPTAYGIMIGHDLNGKIDTSGTISATAETSFSDASAYGIYVRNVGADGQINVSGLIEASASAVTAAASAYAIYVSGDMGGDIVVSGTIDAQALNNDSYYLAYAAGIYLRSDRDSEMSGTITIAKTGVVHMRAENDSYFAVATGIEASTNITGVIENNGLISAEAYGTYYASAYGIDAGHLDGSISNPGRIQVKAVPDNNYGSAYGIYVGSVGVNGTVTNSGYIDVHVAENNNSTSSYAGGVLVYGMAGHFTNTGSIIATSSNSVGTALNVWGDGGLVTLNTKGFIVGDIELHSNIYLNVQGDVGRSVHWTVDNFYRSGGDDYTNDEGYRGTSVFERYSSGYAEYATFDNSGLVAMRQASADAGFIGLDTLVSKTGAAAANPVKAADGTGGTHLMPFIAAASQSRTYSVDDSLDQDVSTSSVSFGNTMTMANGMFLGIGGGKVSGSTDVSYMGGPASKSDQQGAFLGVALSGSLDKLHFAAAISGGRMQVDSTRSVNDNTVFDGLVEEKSSFDSTFMAAEIAVSGHFDIGNGMAVAPNSVLKYAQHHVDGYAETGSDAAAAVGSQKFGAFEGELGLALEKKIANGVFSGGISVMSRSVSGDEGVQVSMIGDTQVVDATIPSLNANKLSLGYASSFSGSGQFNLGFETLLGSDGMSGGKISGQLRFSF